MSLNGTSALACSDRHTTTAILANGQSVDSYWDSIIHLRRAHEAFFSGFSAATSLVTTIIQKNILTDSGINIPQMDIIGVARTFRIFLEGLAMTRGKDFREELTAFIADRFRELEKVDAVNVNFDGDLKTVTFTILVDMPEYDDELMDRLLDVELDWAPKAAGWGVRVSCIYLPSSFVEPDLCLSSTTINNLV